MDLNPLQTYQVPPTSTIGNQFLAYKQPANYMTDQRPSSDLYAFLINNAVSHGDVTTGHQLRQHLQDNAVNLMKSLEINNGRQFINLQTPGAPNTCSGYEGGVIFSHGKPLVSTDGNSQAWIDSCSQFPNSECMMTWKNTPLPQQGPHCQEAPPKSGVPGENLHILS